MSNQIEQIRAEIERRNLANYCGTAEQYEEELFAILDTIEAAKPTCKNCRHYENDCPQIRGMFAPYPSRVCKDYSDTTAQARPVPADVQEAADKAAKKYARDTFINECMENGACDANDLAYAFKAGIAYERERMMKEAPVADVIEMRGRTEKGYPLELTLGFPRIPNIEYHGGKVRVIIEEIKD